MKLSLVSYAWKCVLGIEVIYFLCLAYGIALSGQALVFHQTFFATLPFFGSGGAGGIIMGALDVGVFAFLFGLYIAWMHNSSIEK